MLSIRPRSSGLAGPKFPALIARRHAALCLAGALMLAQLPACASRSQADGQPVSMSIVDRETGQVMTTYCKDGRTYVAGRPAARYAIRLANQTGGRVMVVLSVDGVNVITGETASVGQSGYVLDPWQSYDIREAHPTSDTCASLAFSGDPPASAHRGTHSVPSKLPRSNPSRKRSCSQLALICALGAMRTVFAQVSYREQSRPPKSTTKPGNASPEFRRRCDLREECGVLGRIAGERRSTDKHCGDC